MLHKATMRISKKLDLFHTSTNYFYFIFDFITLSALAGMITLKVLTLECETSQNFQQDSMKN